MGLKYSSVVIGLLTIFLFSMILVSPIAAGTAVSLPTISFTCTTVTQLGGGIINADRDNTGLALERFRLEITDGDGNLLASDQDDVPASGGQLQINAGTFPIETPASNPIHYRAFSVAGNGLPEQVFIDQSFNLPEGSNCVPDTSAKPKVKHLNIDDCDDSRVYIYADYDDFGEPSLHVYRSISAEEGDLTYEIADADVATLMANPPAENTWIKAAYGFDLYVLTTGELQINTPYDFEGKSCVVIFNGLRPTEIYSYMLKR